MLNLSWDDFKECSFAIRCRSKSADADFFDSLKKTDINYYTIDFPAWGMFEEDTCYLINSNNQLDLCHKDYCDYNKIPVIDWKVW